VEEDETRPEHGLGLDNGKSQDPGRVQLFPNPNQPE
jgi:hypothetical protein